MTMKEQGHTGKANRKSTSEPEVNDAAVLRGVQQVAGFELSLRYYFSRLQTSSSFIQATSFD